MHGDELDPEELATVTGGRIENSQGRQPADPRLVAAMTQAKATVKQLADSRAKQSKDGVAEMMQKLVEAKRGGGGVPA